MALVMGDRAAKLAEIRQAVSDCVQRKRLIRWNMDNSERALEDARKLREQAASLIRRADAAEASVLRGQDLLDAEDAEILRLRTELASVERAAMVNLATKAARELASVDAGTVAALLAERPDLAGLLALLPQEARR